MSPSRTARLVSHREEKRVRSGDVEVVDFNGYLREDRFNEAAPSGFSSGIRQLDANQEFGRCHGGDDDVVIIAGDLF